MGVMTKLGLGKHMSTLTKDEVEQYLMVGASLRLSFALGI